MGTHPVTMSKVELTGPEKGRAFKLFKMLDLDGNGKIEVDEICIVHDSDKDSMINILDANGDNQVDKDEWIGYMMIKKAEKGDRKFGFFLNYLEKEIPDKIPAMKIQRAKKAKNPQAKAKAVKSVKRSVKKAKKEEPVEDVADIIFECPHATHGLPVPESVVKKRATAESVAMARAEEAANAKAGRRLRGTKHTQMRKLMPRNTAQSPGDRFACVAKPKQLGTTLWSLKRSSCLWCAFVVSMICIPRPRRSFNSCVCAR